MTLCKCGICALDCEYHRPSHGPRKGSIDGINWGGMTPAQRMQFLEGLYQADQITLSQYQAAIDTPFDDQYITF